MSATDLNTLKNEKAKFFFEEALDYLAKNSFSIAQQKIELAENLLINEKDTYWLALVRLEKVKTLRGLKEYEAAERLIQDLWKYFSVHHYFYHQVLVFIDWAEIAQDQNLYKQAVEKFHQAYETALYHKFTDLFVYICHNLAISYQQIGLINEAIQYTNQTIAHLDKQENEAGWAHQQLGDLLMSIFHYQQAIPHYVKAQKNFLQIHAYDQATQCMEALSLIYQETGEARKQEAIKKQMIEINQLRIL